MSPLRSNHRLAPWLLAATLGLPATASAALLSMVSPLVNSYSLGTDFTTVTYSGIGDVTATVSPVDLQLGLGNASTSGCEAADFAGFAVGHIALIQRGSCLFSTKVLNAEAAGAAGVLLFNQGNTADPGRQDAIGVTLGDLFPVAIPVLFMTYSLGEDFSTFAISGLVVRMEVNAGDPIRPTVVPEPGTLALLALGLAGVATTRRRRGQIR